MGLQLSPLSQEHDAQTVLPLTIPLFQPPVRPSSAPQSSLQYNPFVGSRALEGPVSMMQTTPDQHHDPPAFNNGSVPPSDSDLLAQAEELLSNISTMALQSNQLGGIAPPMPCVGTPQVAPSPPTIPTRYPVHILQVSMAFPQPVTPFYLQRHIWA